MATLHVFNPEHDWALSQTRAGGSPPHAASALRQELAYLPALMAAEGDYVIVPDVACALQGVCRWRPYVSNVHFVSSTDSLSATPITDVCPWGWDANIRHELLRQGVGTHMMPTEKQIETLRDCSHRKHTQTLLKDIYEAADSDDIVGESMFFTAYQQISDYVRTTPQMVVKAPWSSSGRGVIIIKDGTISDTLQRRIKNIISQQGGVMCEPFYEKIHDLAMEFDLQSNGKVTYLGLSLFQTQTAQYSGNIIADEGYKRQFVSRYLSLDLLDCVCQILCNLLQKWLAGCYYGPLGVDMMIVRRRQRKKDETHAVLHPCVEVNLRHTMGHVALSLSKRMTGLPSVMRIVRNPRFSLQVSPLKL